ncbi:hypothetical protein [Halocalculus aciditolerans]|uniref:Uncharacterized protein n=1 Tax=Halocalculus aciditolerans TaxID=1383812 RepID=A0A830EZS3_9EURY|nr:hypothetical protein [Halocalculus aciditolerans]GGL46648.1 hypothetical protein GCM10009039_01280 [Halocalculus aciditolerans]
MTTVVAASGDLAEGAVVDIAHLHANGERVAVVAEDAVPALTAVGVPVRATAAGEAAAALADGVVPVVAGVSGAGLAATLDADLVTVDAETPHRTPVLDALAARGAV